MKPFILTAVLFFTACQIHADLILADRGSSDYVIIIPDNTDKQTKESAATFSDIFRQMTGVELPVCQEGKEPAGKNRIAIGATGTAEKAGVKTAALAREEQVIKTAGKDLILTGGKSLGVVFAVYDFLQNQGGCDWFDAWNVQIPKIDKFIIPELDIRKEPSFLFRRMFTQTGAFGWKGGANLQYPLKSSPYTVYGSPGDCHTFYAYSKDWPKDNLELFSMNERGKREMPRGQMGANFCITNPESVERVKKKLRTFIVADRAKAKREGYPAPFIYDISHNDCSNYFCLCPNCKAFAEKHGQSGLLINFINQIADDIKDDFPEIIIATFAYEFTETPPADIAPASNVLFRLCHTKGDYFHPVTEDSISNFPRMLETWGKTAAKLGIWDYWIFFWDQYPAPYHNANLIKKNLQTYKDNHAIVIMAESENGETANFFAMKYWLGHKLMDDLSQSDTELIDRFIKGYYGPGANGIKEFYDYLTTRQQEITMKIFTKTNPDKAYLDRDFYLKCEDIFTRAEAACEPGSPAMINVRRERIPVDISMLYLWDKLKLPFDKETILKRYEEYRLEQINFRRKESARGEAISTLNAELTKLRNSESINLQKKSEPRAMSVPNTGSWNKAIRTDGWFEYYGVKTDRKISMQARHDNNTLYLRFTEENIGRPLRSTVQLWDGDEWEIMLGGAREKAPFMQIMTDSAKKIQILQNISQPDGSDKVEKYNASGIAVDSEVKDETWTLTVKIPFAAIPVKELKPGGVIYGNFFRSANAAELAQAWNPPFERYFRNRNAFGKIILEK